MARTFMQRRLQQLVREELARTDVKALVREVVQEFFREDERRPAATPCIKRKVIENAYSQTEGRST